MIGSFDNTAVELHLVDLRDLSDATRSSCVRILDNDERNRHDNFVYDKDRNIYAVAHALLRFVLLSRVPIVPKELRFGRESFGRPFALNSTLKNLSFNLSHSMHHAAVAICSSPARIGVDIESFEVKKQASYETLPSFCSADERVRLSLIDNPTEFAESYIATWTLKESVLKAIGVGISDHLCAVETNRDPLMIRLPDELAQTGVPCSWQDCDARGSIISITVLRNQHCTVTPEIRWWEQSNFDEMLTHESTYSA